MRRAQPTRSRAGRWSYVLFFDWRRPASMERKGWPLNRHNIELSCAAESPARSEPQQRHPYEKEDHLWRQLQRFVRFLYSLSTFARASATLRIDFLCVATATLSASVGLYFKTSCRVTPCQTGRITFCPSISRDVNPLISY